MKQIRWFRSLTIIDLPHHRNCLRVHSNGIWLPGPQDQWAGTRYWRYIQLIGANRISRFLNLKEKGSDSWIRHNRVEIRRPGVCLICFHASSIVFLAGVNVESTLNVATLEFTSNIATIDQLDESVNLAAGLVIEYWLFKFRLRVGREVCEPKAQVKKESFLIYTLSLEPYALSLLIWL